MALALNKLILSGTATNAAGAYLQVQTVTSSTTAPGATVPAGIYMLEPSANVSVVYYDGSSNVTCIAANVGGMFLSDGTNVYLKSSAGNANVTLITVNGGQSAPGTYNS
jgi:hypothetical protein